MSVLITSDGTFRYLASVIVIGFIFFLSIFFIFGAGLSTAWCVSAALPKDHPSIKQYGVGTIMAPYLDFLLIKFWVCIYIYFFFVCYLCIGHRRCQLSLLHYSSFSVYSTQTWNTSDTPHSLNRDISGVF